MTATPVTRFFALGYATRVYNSADASGVANLRRHKTNKNVDNSSTQTFSCLVVHRLSFRFSLFTTNSLTPTAPEKRETAGTSREHREVHE